MADAPERPQVDIMAGDVSVVVTGREADTLEDVQQIAEETFDHAVSEYVDKKDSGRNY